MATKHSRQNPALRGAKEKTAKKRILSLLRYLIPAALKAVFTQTHYCRWLRKKGLSVMTRDRKMKRPCTLGMTISDYERKIHAAACRNALIDPFTGETLAWELVGQYDPKQAKKEWGYFKRFWLLPSVDHINPDSDILEFEICAWLVNLCKGEMTPDEFTALCGKIVSWKNKPASRRNKAVPEAPALYFLPPYLEGIMTLDTYRKMIETKAHHLFVRDQKGNRPCVKGQTCAGYKMEIHRTFLANGPLDPYTGDPMDFALIGVLDPGLARKDGRVFMKKFGKMPTIDHIDPDATDLKFEVCSLLVNECKNDLNADEFVGLCNKVVAFRGKTDLPNRKKG